MKGTHPQLMRARTTASARYDLGLAIKTIGHQRCAKALILRLLGIPDVCTCIVRPARKKRGVVTKACGERRRRRRSPLLQLCTAL